MRAKVAFSAALAALALVACPRPALAADDPVARARLEPVEVPLAQREVRRLEAEARAARLRAEEAAEEHQPERERRYFKDDGTPTQVPRRCRAAAVPLPCRHPIARPSQRGPGMARRAPPCGHVRPPFHRPGTPPRALVSCHVR